MNLAMIVDDELNIRSMLHDKLNSLGFASWAGMNGKAGVEKLERDVIALALSDPRMRGISGMELLKDAQKISPHTPFVMMAGKDDTHKGPQAMQQGAAGHLVKPLQLGSLVASVAQALARRRLELEVENYRDDLEHMVQGRMQQLRTVLNRIELLCDETLEALGAALDLRDTETAGHSQRVRGYSIEIAKVLGCTNEQLKELARGAYLHDIGKIGIPDAILLKPGKLSKEETAVMKTHVKIGYELVSQFAFLAGAAEIVLTHHERYDGTGYPQGLMREQIPLPARVFAVADTLDSLTSDRPYRRALSFPIAKREIVRQSGSQFDPKVVQAFLSVRQFPGKNIRRNAAESRTTSWTVPAPIPGERLPALSPHVV